MCAATKMTFLYFAALLTFGLLFHLVQKAAKHYGWWEFVEAPPKKKRSSTLNGSSTPTGISPVPNDTKEFR
jgi:hypothetical protein